MSGESSDPAYILGFRAKYLIILVVLFAVSLILVIYVGELFVAVHGVNNSGTIYFGLNYAGFLSTLVIIFAFLAVIGAFGAIIAAIVMLSVGQLRLYDDRVVWKRRGNSRELEYSDMTDAYFGYDASLAYNPYNSASGMSPTGNQSFDIRRVVSFYIDNKRFTFNTRRRPGLTKFLETRIPKQNIDVEDDDDQ